MRKIVIVTHEPLTKNLKRIFYIEEYRNSGFEVEVWDISTIANKGLSLSDEIEDHAILKFDSLSTLKVTIENKDNRNTIYILQLPQSWKNRKIIKILSDNSCYCVNIEYYANAYTKTTFQEKLKKYFLFKKYPELIKLKLEQKGYKLYRSYHKIAIPQRNFTSLSIDKTATDYINHPDYESYLDIIGSEKADAPKRDFIVFIDNYFPLHPDLYFHHKIQLSGVKEYQQSLTRVFDQLEEKYNMPVIIAAHPKAEYAADTFGKHDIVKYKTAELVINSTYVIQHTSNSISYAILANKPIALITTNGYNKVRHLIQNLQKMARITNLKLFNIDKIATNEIEFTQIEESVRRDYIETYLHRHKLGNVRNIDILSLAFKNLNI